MNFRRKQGTRTKVLISICCATAILSVLELNRVVVAADGVDQGTLSTTGKRKYGFLRPQNDMLNHSLFMGLDVPPNERVHQNSIPRTQNDFLLIRKKNQDVLEKDPKNTAALLQLGYASRNLNELDRDIDCCTKALALDPNFAAAYAERGMAFEGAKDFEKALTDFRKAISLEPKNSVFYAHVGRLHLREGKLQEAIAECTKSIGMSDQDSAVFYYRGKAYLTSGEFKKAISDFDSAIKLDKDSEIGYYIDRACANTHLDLIDQAIDDLRIAVKVDADDFPRQMDVAFTNGESENTPQARQRIFDLAKELVDVKPCSPILRKALFHRFLGKYSEAIAEFDKAAKLYPTQPELYLYRGETYSDMNEHAKALGDFTKLLQLEPANPDGYSYRAQTFLKQKEYAKAIDDLSQLIKIRPDRTAYILRSGAYRAIGDLEKSAEDRKNFLAVAQAAYQARNNPSLEVSSKFLERDLDDFFSKKIGKKVHVDFAVIPVKMQPSAMFGLPRSYFWLKILQDGKLVDQGAACLLAVQKERYVVHKYASITEIKKNPRTIDQSCPSEVRDSIFEHAGVLRP